MASDEERTCREEKTDKGVIRKKSKQNVNKERKCIKIAGEERHGDQEKLTSDGGKLEDRCPPQG